MNTFKIGDTVQLKSGGPITTVARVINVDEDEVPGGISINCQRFLKQEVRSGSFHPDTLEPTGNEAPLISFLPERV